jgi:hypothetical protein
MFWNQSRIPTIGKRSSTKTGKVLRDALMGAGWFLASTKVSKMESAPLEVNGEMDEFMSIMAIEI